MVVDNSLESLLSNLTTSVQTATEALPEDEDLLPPKDGISLLDTKNDLLLSYLQNLVFLILLKLRSRSASNGVKDDASSLQDEVVKKLVELRVYLEKGVRPLENRLKYQIDKIVRAADDAERKSAQTAKKPMAKRVKATAGSDSDSDASDADSVGTDQSEEETAEVSYGPKTANFKREKSNHGMRASVTSKDGIYRPPKITPVSMPTTEAREEKKERRPGKSATLDEFVASELSTAPMAQPSIGSTIVQGGRRTKSERERREEAEKRDYEESNFIRLPGKSKKEMAKQSRGRQGGFGGEEWRGIDAGLGRIERLTQKKSGGGGSLGKSRKRGPDDGGRGGAGVGDAFEKRRKVVAGYRR